MKPRPKTPAAVFAVLAASASLLGQTQGSRPPSAPPAYRHAYYLFLAQPSESCEACYVPLLLTSMRLDDRAQNTRFEACVVTTYERDSISRIERAVPMSPSDVTPGSRQVQVKERTYRYQEVTASEVLRLLEKPEGTIAIHRTLEMRVPSSDELADLIASFRAVK
jgi:hypothetical protein